jgi:hypothetical protein
MLWPPGDNTKKILSHPQDGSTSKRVCAPIFNYSARSGATLSIPTDAYLVINASLLVHRGQDLQLDCLRLSYTR